MADIVEGDTIQAAWFANIDSTGALKNTITLLNDNTALKLQKSGTTLLQLEKDGSTPGLLRLKDGVETNDPTI